MSEATPHAEGRSVLMDRDEIQRIIPHRDPFLLIDRVLSISPGKQIIAEKDVTGEEHFFTGHFPGFPIMPGVLVVEAMAQAGAVLLLKEVGDSEEGLVVFTGIERARFRRPIFPGDQVRIEVNVLAFRRVAGRMEGKAYVGDTLACEAIISCALADPKVMKRGKSEADASARS